jgi:hypothetical protein
MRKVLVDVNTEIQYNGKQNCKKTKYLLGEFCNIRIT